MKTDVLMKTDVQLKAMQKSSKRENKLIKRLTCVDMHIPVIVQQNIKHYYSGTVKPLHAAFLLRVISFACQYILRTVGFVLNSITKNSNITPQKQG